MSTLTVSNVSDGTLSIPTTYVTNGSAKAWVNFNGTSTVATRDSFNVSSLTDNGTAVYSVSVTSAFDSANHCPLVSTSNNNGRSSTLAVSSTVFASNSISISTSSWTVGHADVVAVAYNGDAEFVMTNSHGDLA